MIIVKERNSGSKLLPIILIVILLSCTNLSIESAVSSGVSFITSKDLISQKSTSSIDIDELPTTQIELTMSGGSLGSSITGVIQFEFGLWPDEDTIVGIGFSEEEISTQHSELYIDIVSIGCDVMRIYVFAYTDDTTLFDNYKDGEPAGEYYRNNWTWSSNNCVGASIERINETTLDQLTVAGCIIEYENLTAHYEDGSSCICGPQYITIGANFTKTDDVWSVDRILSSSESNNVQIGDNSIEIMMGDNQPLRPQTIAIIVGVPLVIVIAVVAWWRYKKNG